MAPEQTEQQLIDDLWATEDNETPKAEDVEEKVEETPEEEEEEEESPPEEEPEEEEEKEEEEEAEEEEKSDDTDEDSEDKEEVKKDSLEAARKRIRERKDAEESENLEKYKEESKNSFDDDDFKSAMDFEFGDESIELDGESKKLSDIAKEYEDVSALIKFAVAKATKANRVEIEELHNTIAVDRMWNDVEKKHPEARGLGKNDEFMTWLGSQDDDIKMLANSGVSDDIIIVLDGWKEGQKPPAAPEPTEEEKLEAARARKKQDLLKGGKKKGSTPVIPAKKDDLTGDLTDAQIDSIWDEED
jgi:hypothetical protein